MRILRWILVWPAAIAAWIAVFFLGVYTHGWIERTFCPPLEFVSGMCANPRMMQALKATEVLFIALSAVAVELAAAITAPEKKLTVTWLTFAAGTVFAVDMAVGVRSPGEGAAAVGAGLLTALLLTRRLRLRASQAK